MAQMPDIEDVERAYKNDSNLLNIELECRQHIDEVHKSIVKQVMSIYETGGSYTAELTPQGWGKQYKPLDQLVSKIVAQGNSRIEQINAQYEIERNLRIQEIHKDNGWPSLDEVKAHHDKLLTAKKEQKPSQPQTKPSRSQPKKRTPEFKDQVRAKLTDFVETSKSIHLTEADIDSMRAKQEDWREKLERQHERNQSRIKSALDRYDNNYLFQDSFHQTEEVNKFSQLRYIDQRLKQEAFFKKSTEMAYPNWAETIYDKSHFVKLNQDIEDKGVLKPEPRDGFLERRMKDALKNRLSITEKYIDGTYERSTYDSRLEDHEKEHGYVERGVDDKVGDLDMALKQCEPEFQMFDREESRQIEEKFWGREKEQPELGQQPDKDLDIDKD